MRELIGDVKERQRAAFECPIWRIAQAQDRLYREVRELPTGYWLQTVLTVDCFEEPWSWHVAVGFLMSPVNLQQKPIKADDLWKRIVELETVPFAQWDQPEKQIAMNCARELLYGVGAAREVSWNHAQVYDLTFQAWRDLSPEERVNVEKKMDEVDPTRKFILNRGKAADVRRLVMPGSQSSH